METLLLVVRVAMSLAAVLGIIWFLRRRIVRATGGAAKKLISVVSRQGLGQKASIIILDADGKRLTLGVTEHSVTVLHSCDAPEPEPEEAVQGSLEAAPAKSWIDTWNKATAGSVVSGDTWKAAGAAFKGRGQTQ